MWNYSLCTCVTGSASCLRYSSAVCVFAVFPFWLFSRAPTAVCTSVHQRPTLGRGFVLKVVLIGKYCKPLRDGVFWEIFRLPFRASPKRDCGTILVISFSLLLGPMTYPVTGTGTLTRTPKHLGPPDHALKILGSWAKTPFSFYKASSALWWQQGAAGYHSTVWIYSDLLTHSPVDWHLGCSEFLTITNHIAHVFACVSWVHIHISEKLGLKSL